MVEIEEVVEIRLVKLAWAAHRRASECATPLHRNTSAIVAEIVCIVLLSLRFEFSKTLLCIATLVRLRNRDVARAVSSSRVVTFVKLMLG